MNVWLAIIFGIVQGITEFIPVSSTGHLVLTEKVFGVEETELLFFYSMLHLGTLIAVFVVMRKDIVSIFKDIFGKMTRNLVIATIPAVIAAVFLKGFIEKAFDGSFMWISFIFTGALLLSIVFIKDGERLKTDIKWLDALLVGFAQAIAILPGVSRSGSCVSMLRYLKIKREDAIKFAFLMSIPAILGSFANDMIGLARGNIEITSNMALCTVIGVIFAGISGYLAMEFMIRKLTKKGFLICASYLFVLGVFVALDQFVFNIFM